MDPGGTPAPVCRLHFEAYAVIETGYKELLSCLAVLHHYVNLSILVKKTMTLFCFALFFYLIMLKTVSKCARINITFMLWGIEHY